MTRTRPQTLCFLFVIAVSSIRLLTVRLTTSYLSPSVIAVRHCSLHTKIRNTMRVTRTDAYEGSVTHTTGTYQALSCCHRNA